MSNVVHLMGPTCAGKSTLIQRLLAIAPSRVHAVEVGKMLRAKYGEDYFKGQAAPQHTQGEAWEMYLLGVKQGISEGKDIILVDGQPRDIQQARDVIGLWRNPHRASYLLIHANHEERERRARGTRAPGPNLDLALARLNNDYKNCYVVMAELMMKDQMIRVIDTSSMVDSNALAELVLAEYGG